MDRYNLDFSPLLSGRKTVWGECWVRLQEYMHELGLFRADPTNVIARQQVKDAANRVRELIRDDKEFSAVARACVESTGDPRVLGFLRSA